MLENELFFVDTVSKLHAVMLKYENKVIRIAYSGGADSDNLLWLFQYCGYRVKAVFYDTGLEYKATHEHVDYMISLGFEIEKIKALVPIPLGQKQYGSAFISKYVSDMLMRLQKHGFDFNLHGKLAFDELVKLYPKAKSALRWWTNTHKGMRHNINWNRGLKEFLIQEGLPFKVSHKCCDGAKKLPLKQYAKDNAVDLMILGLRKSEGGKRASTYKSCFLPKNSYSYAMYFPMFFWTNEDKQKFEKEFLIEHSKAYTEYGLKRTGCAGCPFGLNFEKELQIIEDHEPKLLKAVNNIFANPYDWTRKYKEFQKELKTK